MLVGWPIVTFLIAEPLRNLGKYTFADVASFRLDQTSMRILAACGSLVTVAFYLIAQMVGAGKLIQILFGLDYWIAVVIVGALMIIYVTFGGMLATTWVQIIKAVPAVAARRSWRCWCCGKFGFSPERAVRQGGRGASEPSRDHGPDLAGRSGLQSGLGDLDSAWR